jgi:hypothetical protein
MKENPLLELDTFGQTCDNLLGTLAGKRAAALDKSAGK